MKLTDPAGRREIINVYPFASPSLHSPASLASFPPPAVLSSNLRRQNNRDEENVVSNFGHCSHGNDWGRGTLGGRRRGRSEIGSNTCAKLICQLSAVRRLFRESRPLAATHFSALAPLPVRVRSRLRASARSSPPPHPSDTSVCNLRTGSPRQAGSPPKRRVFYFVTH